MTRRTARADAGFTLPELTISIGLMLLVLAGVFSTMTNGMRAEESTRLTTSMNSNLRAAMDLIVREFLQIGQGLPDARRIEVPHENGALAVLRPGPTAAEAGACGGVPADFGAQVSLPAITVGAGLGPAINGVCTDVITMFAADGAFDHVSLRALAANGSSIVVARPLGQAQGVAGGVDIDDGNGDDIRIGDLIMLTRGSASTLMYVSGVNGNTQTITFAAGDPFRLNQFDPIDADPLTDEMAGTINALLSGAGEPTAPVNNANGTPRVAATQATRVRMISYFVDYDDADPDMPRLVRTVDGRTNVVAQGVETFNLTYDLVDAPNNWTDVDMTAADLAGGGGCGAAPCSVNQIRKVNVTLSMRSRERFSQTDDFMRNTLYSQVAVRSLAFVDRYR